MPNDKTKSMPSTELSSDKNKNCEPPNKVLLSPQNASSGCTQMVKYFSSHNLLFVKKKAEYFIS